MNVIVAESAGFCWGVQRAVDRARAVATASGGPVFTDGPLIHNLQMIDQLRQEGIAPTEDSSQARDGVLIIRAHGIPPDRRRHLASIARELVDATCPDVARIQGLIRSRARRGVAIVIYGDEGHAEVTGLLGYAEGLGHVVACEADVDRLPALGKKVCLVSQSTQLPRLYAVVAGRILQRFPDTEVLDTICESTKRRQRDLERLAETVDALVVVGGAHSANTSRLVELARALRKTFQVETADEIRDSDFAGLKSVGLTAGASTPAFVIDAVRKRLQTIGGAGEG